MCDGDDVAMVYGDGAGDDDDDGWCRRRCMYGAGCRCQRPGCLFGLTRRVSTTMVYGAVRWCDDVAVDDGRCTVRAVVGGGGNGA